jgi:serine/threonine protein kinase
MLNSS